MWQLFKRTPEKKLRKEYARLMNEAYRLSTINRMEADKKYALAEDIMNKLEALKKS